MFMFGRGAFGRIISATVLAGCIDKFSCVVNCADLLIVSKQRLIMVCESGVLH